MAGFTSAEFVFLARTSAIRPDEGWIASKGPLQDSLVTRDSNVTRAGATARKTQAPVWLNPTAELGAGRLEVLINIEGLLESLAAGKISFGPDFAFHGSIAASRRTHSFWKVLDQLRVRMDNAMHLNLQ